MSQFQEDGFDYMVANYEMADFDDDAEDELNARPRGLDVDTESDTDDSFDGDNKSPDTTAVQARRGKDIQGIPWERLNYSREKYRETRLEQYKNYENLPRRRNDLDKECKHSEKGSNFYDFRHNTRSVKPTIVHFQKRLLCLSLWNLSRIVVSDWQIWCWTPKCPFFQAMSHGAFISRSIMPSSWKMLSSIDL